MKNKGITYALIVAVILIWGMIGYRVFSAMTASDDTSFTPAVRTVKEPFDDYNLPKDTTKLLLNYRDPFGQVSEKDTARPEKVVAIHPVKTTTTVPFNWDFVQYSGYLRNPASKKLIAFLTINGKGVTLAEGETMDNVRLLKNLRDSIKISFNGRIKYLPLHARTL